MGKRRKLRDAVEPLSATISKVHLFAYKQAQNSLGEEELPYAGPHKEEKQSCKLRVGCQLCTK